MAGGLLQISAYGSQDLYLTGTPEITFFKVVYRRHTNFSVESIKVNFDDTVGFGLESTVVIPKIGDLMYRTYLEIILPRIDLKRDNSNTKNDGFLAFDLARDNYQILIDFMSINRNAYKVAFDEFIAENTNNADAMIEKINLVFDDVTNAQKIQNFKDFLLTTNLNPPFKYEEIAMQDIVDNLPTGSSKDTYFLAMNVGLDKSIKTQDFFRLDLLEKKETHLDNLDDNIKFAWVDKIGHAIIEEIEVKIGGNKIDRHLGDWINVWYELTANRHMEHIYNKMIGNIDILTSFDRNLKPNYILRVPLQFWFCRHNGLSIPLVSLQYHDVSINVRFRKIEEVAYIEENETIFVTENKEQLFLDEIPGELGIDISANLSIDYIYLDSPERRRFAQSSHEYLIEQVQVLEINSVKQQNFQIVLNNFVHPSKELIWVAQQEKFLQNFNGYTKTRRDNYSISESGKGNIIQFTTLDFHSFNRVSRQEGNYFNYVQPYETHNTTPSDGINMYSFSLFPEDSQPSGSANMTRLSRVLLQLEFDPILFPEDEDGELLTIRIYTRNFNILRFISGLAGCALTYG